MTALRGRRSVPTPPFVIARDGDEDLEPVEGASLARYPENGWALHGLAEYLRNKGREKEATTAMKAAFKKAWARRHPRVCFCRAAGTS